MKARTETLAVLAIFIFTGLIFFTSHVHQIADSKYSMLLSESLLHHGTFTLDRYTFPDYGKLGGTRDVPAQGIVEDVAFEKYCGSEKS